MTRRHEARHQLPISNGYGFSCDAQGTINAVSVHCGRCRDSFLPDAEWVERYFSSHPEWDEANHRARLLDWLARGVNG